MKLSDLIKQATHFRKYHKHGFGNFASCTVFVFDSLEVEKCHNGRELHPVTSDGIELGLVTTSDIHAAISAIKERKLDALGLTQF